MHVFACVFRVLLLVGGLGFWCVEPQAAKVNVPSNLAPVVDEAGLFSLAFENHVNDVLRGVYSKHQIQVGVLSVSSLNGISIEEFSIEVASAWALGTEKGDRGVLVVLAPNERKVRIEVGRGLEGDLTDLQSARIINQVMIPNFKKGDWELGLQLGLNALLADALKGQLAFPEAKQKSLKHQNNGEGIFWVLVFGWLVIWVLMKGLSGGGGGPRSGGGSWNRKNHDFVEAVVLGALLGSRRRGRSHYGGFGGFGGGWGGGGGSFGGGGASGSW